MQVSKVALSEPGYIGDYNFENVMAAVAIGLYFGVSPEKIDMAISSYQPENNRSQMIRTES